VDKVPFDLRFLNRAEMVRFVRFSITGLLNTAVDFSLFMILSYFGVWLLVAQAVGYTGGMLNSFLINRSWTFGSREPIVGRQLVRFVFSNIIQLVLSMFLLQGLVVGMGLSKLIGKVLTIGFIVTLSFFVNRLWVFRP
jgi:putative flippase GtrA